MDIAATKMNNKPTKSSQIASKIPTSGRDSGTHSRSSSVSNLTTTSDIHSETGDASSENMDDFKINERVWVNGTKPGHIKFLGKTEFAPGIWAGVLLDEPAGKNDGSVAGVKYFTCEPLRGIFARPNKLSRTAGAASPVVGDSTVIGFTTPKFSSAIPSSRASVSSNVSATSIRQCSRLRVGERITVSSLGGQKPGTLKFVGETEFAKGEWAGIELDEPSGKNDGSVAGKRYFTCQMKYGLFAPMHKISRAGGTGTPLSRPTSARGTPLMRSSSRDSLSSSVSNCSRSSRVKLGITSLSSAQKKISGSSGGITTTSKALQEALKEKDLHIEQLLKERDLDRAEFAKVTSHFEELETKSSELEKKHIKTEGDRKALEEQLSTVKRKLEDIQFQLEEEKIAKSDFEVELQQRSKILKRIEELVSNNSGDTFLNIREILSGKETLSEIVNEQSTFAGSEELNQKIANLESSLKQLSKEKEDIFNKLNDLQKATDESSKKNENVIETLETAVQEKEDIIVHLKTELNGNIEKVSQLIEDNKTLSEQILFKEEEAKGHADDVIKELGEKVNTLKEEVKSKSLQLNEHIACIQEKDNSILAFEQSLSTNAASVKQLQNELDTINAAFKQKENDLEQNIAAKKSLEESIAVLKSEVESNSDEKQKKIDLLDQEVKTKSAQVTEYLASVQEKEILIASLKQNSEDQAATLSQLQKEQKETLEIVKKKDIEIEENAAKQKALEEQIAALQSLSDSSNSEKEEKMLNLIKEIESLTNTVQSKEEQVDEVLTKLKETQTNNVKLEETIQELTERVRVEEVNLSKSNNIASLKIMSLQEELQALEIEKVQRLGNAEVEIHNLREELKLKEEELQAKSNAVVQDEAQISTLNEKLSNIEEECSVLKQEVGELTKKSQILFTDKENLEISLNTKKEEGADFIKQIDNLKTSLDKINHESEEKDKKLQMLQDNFISKDEENKQLASKLQLAEQKVEMLNKDSSDHVMSLQNELSKLKEETTATITRLEQELNKIKNERDKSLDITREKERCLQEKVEAMTSLEKLLKDKETQLINLNSEKEEVAKGLHKYKASLEEEQKKLVDIQSNLQAELKAKLAEKEKEISDAIEQVGRLSSDMKDKEESNSRLTKLVKSLEVSVEEQKEHIMQLTVDKTRVMTDINQITLEFELKERLLNEKLSNLTVEYDDMLKQKEQSIQDIQTEFTKQSGQLASKTKELENKENEISTLKNVVKEKDDQFEELSKMIESSQCQLVLLKQQNDKNEALLLSKEASIKDVMSDQEKQLQLREQSFKEEISKLQSLIQSKEAEMKQKESIISTLTSEAQEQKNKVEILQTQVEAVTAEKKKLTDDSSSVYQELKKRVEDMEVKYSKLLEEKEAIAKEELKTKEAKKSLELVRETLLQEKSAQEELVKDREAKLEALQAEVNRMQTQFAQHKQDLQQKLDVSQMELEAVSEFKNELEIQHNVCEELQEQLQASEKKRKELETQLGIIPALTDEKNKLQAEIDEFDKVNANASQIIENLETENLALEEQLKNNKNIVLQKEKDLLSLKDQFQKLQEDKVASSSLNSSLKSLQEENNSLKAKITILELSKSEVKPDASAKSITNELSSEDAEEKESLLSQIDFLNSIIVDMKQKNEELTRKLEIQTTCWDEPDINLNEGRKAVAPRLFCDICDMFDLHDTEDCPKQESFLDEEVPQLKKPGTRQLPERPYCNDCEVFGHWTLDCKVEETF